MANFLVWYILIGLLAVLFMVQLPVWASAFLFSIAFVYGMAAIATLLKVEDET